VRDADNLPPYSADVKKSRSLNYPRPLAWPVMGVLHHCYCCCCFYYYCYYYYYYYYCGSSSYIISLSYNVHRQYGTIGPVKEFLSVELLDIFPFPHYVVCFFFVLMRKSVTNFVTFICPSVCLVFRVKQLGCHWTNFHEISHCTIFENLLVNFEFH
jgi:hypothetical protein